MRGLLVLLQRPACAGGAEQKNDGAERQLVREQHVNAAHKRSNSQAPWLAAKKGAVRVRRREASVGDERPGRRARARPRDVQHRDESRERRDGGGAEDAREGESGDFERVRELEGASTCSPHS